MLFKLNKLYDIIWEIVWSVIDENVPKRVLQTHTQTQKIIILKYDFYVDQKLYKHMNVIYKTEHLNVDS